MALNTAKKNAIEYRRERVAELLLKQGTQREIAEILRVSPATINLDIKELNRRWREHATQSINDHKATQLAKIRALKKEAWAAKDRELVRKCIETESKILGTNAPEKLDHTSAGGRIGQVVIIASDMLEAEDNEVK